jgi:hypothetical protein
MKNECNRAWSIYRSGRLCRALLAALLAALSCAGTPHLCAQVRSLSIGGDDLSGQLPLLTLTYIKGNAKTLSVQPDWYADHFDFQPIAIYADQILQINLQFAAAFGGQTIFIGVLEGAGVITTPTNFGAVTIGKDGKSSIGYQAPHDPGHYRIAFRFGSRDVALPLTVLDFSDAGKASNCPKAD